MLDAISTHTPLARRDRFSAIALSVPKISTHTPLARRDYVPNRIVWSHWNFYSHASCEARHEGMQRAQEDEHFYSHASCEARLLFCSIHVVIFSISTYTPHAGRDANISDANISLNHFYSHAPCGARQLLYAAYCLAIFNFYSHAPCGARLI